MAPATRLYCENEKGEKFIIELQNVKQEYFKDRSIYYATFPIQSQAIKGKKWNYSLKAVYTIGILNFSFSAKEKENRYLREIQLMDNQTFEVFYEKLTFIYLEIPEFKKQEDELTTQFDKWLYVLKNLPQFQERPAKLQEKVFEKLFNEAEVAKLNKEDMKTYQESLKAYRDNQNTMDYAIEKAKRQAVTERDFEIARKLKQRGVAIEIIADTTSLTKEQIEKL